MLYHPVVVLGSLCYPAVAVVDVGVVCTMTDADYVDVVADVCTVHMTAVDGVVVVVVVVYMTTECGQAYRTDNIWVVS